MELEDGTQLDPCFADAAVNQMRGVPSAKYFEVPDELRHKVTVRLKAEFHNPMSQYTHKTPLEVTFSTPEVYGRALTLGHFINVQQPPAVVTGFKTYTYSPYLMVDDNDADWENNELIRGTDYQEFLTGLFALANSTLTRLTLEFEVRDPGKTPDIRTRDILDRVGYAARKGLAQPGPVDTRQPAFTELDVTTFFITPGWLSWNGALTPLRRR